MVAPGQEALREVDQERSPGLPLDRVFVVAGHRKWAAMPEGSAARKGILFSASQARAETVLRFVRRAIVVSAGIVELDEAEEFRQRDLPIGPRRGIIA